MQHEGLPVDGLHQAGQLVLLLGGVDMGVSGVVEDPEEVVQPDVHTRGLNQGVVERIDAETPGGDLGANVTIREQHACERIAVRGTGGCGHRLLSFVHAVPM